MTVVVRKMKRWKMKKEESFQGGGTDVRRFRTHHGDQKVPGVSPGMRSRSGGSGGDNLLLRPFRLFALTNGQTAAAFRGLLTWKSFGADRLRQLGSSSHAVGVDRSDSEHVAFSFLQPGHLQRSVETRVWSLTRSWEKRSERHEGPVPAGSDGSRRLGLG